jgi:SAM-dependent methyltransferase
MTFNQLIKDGLLVCSSCRSNQIKSGIGKLTCEVCNQDYVVEEGVLITLPKLTNSRVFGIVSRTFNSPRIYNKLISLKWWVMGLFGARDAMLGIEDLVNTKSVLDVGCGPNLNLPSTEISTGSISRYVGVDFSAAFLKEARRSNPDEKFDFIECDAGLLPFADESFDVVIAAFTIHHVPHEPSVVIDEMFRVARDSVIIFDHVVNKNVIIAKIQKLYWRFFDGGFHYQNEKQWAAALNGRSLVRSLRTGAIGKHVIKVAYAKN